MTFVQLLCLFEAALIPHYVLVLTLYYFHEASLHFFVTGAAFWRSTWFSQKNVACLPTYHLYRESTTDVRPALTTIKNLFSDLSCFRLV